MYLFIFSYFYLFLYAIKNTCILLHRPPPRTTEQRISILNVHMKHMYQSGRVLVSDAPIGTVAHQKLKVSSKTEVLVIHIICIISFI